MLKNRSTRTVALILLITFLLGGVIHLFNLRFQTGDIYPAYSSLRSDPLGTRAFYDSLASFHEFTVQRNFSWLHSQKAGSDDVWFYLGTGIPGYEKIPERVSRDLDRLTESGGRLVISYRPVNYKDENSPSSDNQDDCPDQSVSPTDDQARSQDRARETKPNAASTWASGYSETARSAAENRSSAATRDSTFTS